MFARWGLPIVPVVFGVDDQTLGLFKGAIEAVVSLAGHKMAEIDPNLGANLMVFFCREWDELAEVPHLEQMVPDIGPLVGRIEGGAGQSVPHFPFDKAGAICGCFVFLRMDDHLAEAPADTLALSRRRR